ncbi:MAG: pyridoxamine 5'-phosphate oxidase family protein [Actinomycetota bacterium]
MTVEQREAFLAKTRQAILLRANGDGTANGAPIWFDWDGTVVRFFSSTAAPKVARIRADPRVSLLVTNDVGEPPEWVRFDGTAVEDDATDAIHFATELLAPRYWDLAQPAYAEVVDQWRAAPSDAFVVFRVVPIRIAASTN